MRLDGRLRSIVDKLPLVMDSDHFIIHFGLRNQTCGKGFGSGGVRDRVLISCYLDALERLYLAMTGSPLNRKPPKVGREGKTVVHVFEISDLFPSNGAPFMSVDRDDVPYICLPCRHSEPTIHAELQCATAEAIHEATHVFNYSKRPFFRDLNSVPWVWFGEATAVFMEMLVLPGNPDSLRFAMDWSDRPEVPLNHRITGYQAGMFVRYLAKRMGLEFISQVWTESEERETPFETIARLLPKGQKFISADPEDPDIFASGYCMDSYFLWDYESPGFAPEVYARYGERAISESFILHAGDNETRRDFLDHLACRYYRFYVRDGVKAIQVQLQVKISNGLTLIKAEIATVNTEIQRCIVKPLRAKSSPGPEGSVQLFAELTEIDWKSIDHLILVVSNCGLREAKEDLNVRHDDRQEYTIEASAI